MKGIILQMVQHHKQAPFDELDYLAAEFIEEENFEYAALCFRKQIENNPEDARAFYNLAIILHDLGEFDESIQCYEISKKFGGKTL